MILVTLGTQDKSFSRLLKEIDKEIENKTIKDEVIVQAGNTKYQSKNMKIFDLLTPEELEKLIKKCDILITHGGVGSILSGIKNNKKIIAIARLKKYKEHTNDHQKQIVEEFEKEGYIINLKNVTDLGDTIKNIDKFRPKKFKSNNEKFRKIISTYIEDDNNISWFNKYRKLTSYGYSGIFRSLINILIFSIFFRKMELYLSIILSFSLTMVVEKNINYISDIRINEKKYPIIKIFSLVLDLSIMYLMDRFVGINLVEAKFITAFFIMICNSIIIKYCFKEV